jgi:hypothetical protein
MLRERMNLRSIDGVEIETFDEGVDGNGYTHYYWLSFNDGRAWSFAAFPPSRLEHWVSRRIILRNAAGGDWKTTAANQRRMGPPRTWETL